MVISTNPCHICGSTDLNLVDGFYYCVECGTQDVNVQETVVDHTMLGDGTFAPLTSGKKFSTVLQDAVEMSGEWHKWHAYNFMLAGLTEELIALGAKPTVKKLVIWIWTRYIKKYQIKETMEATQFENISINEESKSMIEENESGNEKSKSEKIIEEGTDDSDEIDELDKQKNPKTKKDSTEFYSRRREIKVVTKGTLLAILYVALNLDKSEIQITHLCRFIREGRLSLYNCLKFVPKELSVNLISDWINFCNCNNEYTPKVIRAYAMTIFKRLDLGVPLVPDLNIIISNYIKELCLPKDFEDLVHSVINLLPCDILQMDKKSIKHLIRTPDYEGICMSYILMVLKMCFGLDCDYEIKLSEAVDKINYEKDHLKAYKLGMYSEPTDRLFSFREWYMYLQFRKMIICKFYLPMARLYNLPVDDCVFMEHLEPRKNHKIKLSDDVTMDILNKIPMTDTGVIPKKEFPMTLTPLATYAEVILEYIQDPDLKLRLCEDFTQYSLKYVTQDLKLPGYNIYSENIIQGVNKTNKIINRRIIGTLTSKVGDTTMVMVRNCENRNWLRTKPPSVNHVTKVNTDICNNNDSGHDTNFKSKPIKNEYSDVSETDIEEEVNEDIEVDIIEEEHEEMSIFDDDFKNLIIFEEKNNISIEESNECEDQDQENSYNLYDSKIKIQDNFDEMSACAEPPINPETVDRDKIIEELIKIACKKYKIHIPGEKEVRRPIKRNSTANIGAGEPKKKKLNVDKLQRGKAADIINGLISAYYENVNNDVLDQISRHVQSVIHMTDNINEQNDHQNFIENTLNTTNNDGDNLHDNTINSVTIDNDDYNDDDDDACIEELPISDPKFDARTHDIKQLYIKCNENLDINDIADIESDPEINKIIDEKISTFVEDDRDLEKVVNGQEELSDSSESEDELPLSALSTAAKNKPNLEKLIQNRGIRKFGYWMKHYKAKAFVRSLDMSHKFNVELMENCPISFVFVIRECASIVNCTTFCLYKCLQALEERLSCYTRN